MNEMSSVQVLGGILLRIGNFKPQAFLTNFKSRLILQKTIYLLQSFGPNIGYQYNWYLRGPYSPNLARDAYRLAKSEASISSIRFLDEKAEQQFTKFQQFIAQNRSNAAWLEKIASIHFLKTVFLISDKAVLFGKVKQKVPSLTQREFEKMYSALQLDGLIT